MCWAARWRKRWGTKAASHGMVTPGSPWDEALASSILDVSGRPFFVFSAPLKNERVGTFDTCMTEEFFRAVCINAGITLHLQVAYGANDHHMIEAAFKAFAHSLQMAVTPLEKGTILSSKGVF